MVRRVLTLPTGRLAVGILSVIVLLAILGPTLARHDPLGTSALTLAGPSW